MRLLNRNPVGLPDLGVLLALAWLAKSSTTLFLGLFIIFSLGRLLLSLAFKLPWQHLRSRLERSPVGSDSPCARRLLALISPKNSRTKGGSPFYSLPKFLVLGATGKLV